MDELRPATPPDSSQARASEVSPSELRRRAHEILSTQRSQLDRFEHELNERLQQLADEIAEDLASNQAEQLSGARQSEESAQLEPLRQQLAARKAELDATRAELDETRIAAKRLDQDARIHESLLAEAQREQQQRRVALVDFQEQLADAQAQLAAARKRQEELCLELAGERERVSAEQEHTKSQRRRIAHELKSRHAASLADLERRKAELQALEAASQAQLETQRAATQTEISRAHQSELDAAREELEQARRTQKRLEQDARLHESLLAEAQSEQQQRRAASADVQEQLADAQAQLAAARKRQEELCLELAGERERVSADRDKTKLQRRRIAREFKSRQAACRADFERRKTELQALEASGQAQLEAHRAAAQTEMSLAQQAELDAAREELEQARRTQKRLEQDARIHESLLAEAQREQQQRRGASADVQEQLADAQAQLAAARKRQEELCLELAGERERVSADREHTKSQRRRIAHEFKSRHAASLADLERRKAELQALETAGQAQPGAQHAAAETEMPRASHAELDAAREELEQARLTQMRLEQDARIYEALLAEAQSEQQQRRIAWAACQESLADLQAQLAAARNRQEESCLELAQERERISDEQKHTKSQRRRIAHEFKSRHAEHLADFEHRKAELQALAAAGHTQLEGQLATVNAESSQGRRQLAEMSKALAERSDELAHTRQMAAALEAETVVLRASLQKAQAEGDRAGDALSQAETASDSHHEELNALRNERDHLVGQLAAAEARLAEPSKADRGSEKRSDLQRRFEMAVEELREMKLAHAELEAKLAKTRGNGAGPSLGAGNGMDWAAQKQRLLASLEADDDDDVDAVAERNSIEGTIRITDEIVAQKDRDIAELNRLLQEQPNRVGAGVAGPAVTDLLDRDEIILQERERLRQVQAEWREKIGKAEIDISLERAKIARDRAELEERMRSDQHEQATRAPEDPRSDNQGKPVRGRWLARLGLKELGEP